MKQAEIEKILAKAGYKHDKGATKVVTGEAGWSRETHYYIGGDGDSDIVGASYSEKGSPKAMIIDRDWEIPQSAKLSETVIRKSIMDKYGPHYDVSAVFGEEKRIYDRDGNSITSEYPQHRICKSGSLQPISYNFYARSDTSYQPGQEIGLYCGSLYEGEDW